MIYLITGEDLQLIKNKIKDILKNETIDSFDISEFDGTDKKINIDLLIQDCNSIPMFSSKKVVFINKPIFLTSEFSLDENSQKKFIELIKNDFSGLYLIMYGNINVDKRKTLYKTLVKHAKIINIEQIKQYEFNSIVKNALNKYNIKLTNEALDELLNRLPIDLINLKTEINKLSSFEEIIELEDIKNLINKPLEDDIFSLINAILDKNLDNSIQYWRDLKKQNYDGVAASLILSTQIRFMFKVKYLYSLGFSSEQIASRIKAHPYRIKIVLRRINVFTINQLLSMLNELAILDQNIKTGKIDANNGFEIFLVNMTR